MSRWVYVVLLLAGIAVGCTKQESAEIKSLSADGSMPPESPRGPGPMVDAATNSTVIADTGDVNATLQQLTMELRDFVVRTRTVPKDFEEFAAKSQVRFPPAPAGKKYALEGQVVILVKD